MKKFTIKALILSLSILFVPNTKCYAPIETVFLVGAIAMEIAGIVVAGVAGFLGYKAIKYVSSSPEKQRERKEKRKKRIAKKAERKRKREAKKKSKQFIDIKTDIKEEPLLAM